MNAGVRWEANIIAISRHIGLLLLLVVGGTADCAQPLTPAELEAAKALFGVDEGQPYVLEIGGWRADQRIEGKPIEAYAYVSLLQPEQLLNRLCVVESRWTQGLVVDETARWLSTLFQTTYVVWEPDTTDCAITSRSQIPEHIRLPAVIDGQLLLRIIDGREKLLGQALEYLPEGERREYSNARLVNIEITHFKYSAQFWSHGHGGIIVYFSDTPSGFKIHKAGRYVH